MQTITLEKLTSQAITAYDKVDDRGKELLSHLFGKDFFIKDIRDRVKTFEDACEVIGKDPEDKKFEEGTLDEIAYKKLKVIAAALNQGWQPDWDNTGEYKWYPWFYLNSPGFRFYVSYCAIAVTYTAGGSRLCFKSEELSTYAGKQFLSLYKDMMVIPK